MNKEKKECDILRCKDHDGLGGWEYEYWCEYCDRRINSDFTYCPHCGFKFTKIADSNRHL